MLSQASSTSSPPICNLNKTPPEPVSNTSPVQVIAWDPSRPWRGPARQPALLGNPLYLQSQLWGPHHLSLGVWGWGSQPAHQLVVRQAGLRLIRCFASFVQFTADVMLLDISLCQASAVQLAGLTLDGMIHICSFNEHLFAVLLLDLVALWLLGQTRGLGTC